MSNHIEFELSVLMPCLNESETIGKCIEKSKIQINNLNLNAEIVVADNGSTDGSIDIAEKYGARIVHVKEKGYGNTLNEGIKNCKGKYIFIADSDQSYDFNEITNFYNKIIEGYDLIQGCRLPSGDGIIEKGAMPITHRYIGNPIFTLMTKVLFGLPFNDIYCGMKIIKKEKFDKISIISTGMVFCLEILIKFIFNKFKTNQLPITLHKDGRIKNKSHLRTISDGLKTLKFIIIFSPKEFFFIPSFIFALISVYLVKDFFFYEKTIMLNDKKYLTNILQSFTSLFLAVQIFMLGLYTSLRSEELGFKRKKSIKNFFNFFSLKKSLIINFLIILISVILSFIIKSDLIILFCNICILVSITIIFNSFFISLLKENN